MMLINVNEQLCLYYERQTLLNAVRQKSDSKLVDSEEKNKRLNLELKKRNDKLTILMKKVVQIPDVCRKILNFKTEVGWGHFKAVVWNM